MELNFPDFPIIGEIYTDETSGFSYKWDGKVWKSFSYDTESSIYLIDDISSLFDGINYNFELRNNGSLFYPSVSHQLVISLDGALQAPTPMPQDVPEGSYYKWSEDNVDWELITPPIE